MSKLFSNYVLAAIVLAVPMAALADNTVTLSSGSGLNLDTNAMGASGGDITWTGTTVTFQGSATGVDLASTPIGGSFNGQAGYSQLVQLAAGGTSTVAAEFGSFLTTSAITPAANDILVVKTNAGNYSAVLVNSISGGSLTVEYTTFSGSSTGGGGGGGPTINAVQNNYSGIQPGLPSYGIAPGSLFVIYGADLSDPGTPTLQSSAAPGLPLTLNHTSISVTVNGKTTTPPIYYTSPTQVAAVLPSNTPAGSGTITVTYNGTASNSASILVTASAFGIDTLSGTGSGTIVATVGSSVIQVTKSAMPGQTITIWGSGIGGDVNNDDRTFPQKQDNLKNAKVYIGDVAATVTYAGRSQYPGVDQINVVVPSIGATPAFRNAGLKGDNAHASGFQPGCSNAVVVVANGISSNFGTLPVAAGGGVCSDPIFGITGTQLQQFGSSGTVKTGSLSLSITTSPTIAMEIPASRPEAQSFTTRYRAGANFQSTTSSGFVSGSGFLSLGSCIVLTGGGGGGTSTSTGLDAGTPITLKGVGQSASLPETATSGTGVGSYNAQLTSPLMGGTAYTFTGPGGKDVGAFTATVTFPPVLTWTNENSISTVTESKGQLVTWTGGAPGTYAGIVGFSSSMSGASGNFFCIAPVEDEQFTVPDYVLLTLPTGSGNLAIANYSNRGTFTATGINYGTISAYTLSSENVTYQ